MAKLSAYIVTLNEEGRLEKTLKAVSKVADEIIIVDSGSTDKTEQIAKKYKCKFFFHKWKNISSQKRYAQNKCQNDLVLSLDADEVLSPLLIQEIKEIKKNQEYSMYNIKRKDMMPGDLKPRLFCHYSNRVLLYNRNDAEMPDDLTHDIVVPLKKNIKIKTLKGCIYHYSYLNLSQTWYKYNMYTDQLLTTAIKTNKKYSKFRLLIEFPFQFIRYYFLKKYFLNGWFGFINSVTLAYFRFLKIAKYIEYQMINKEKNVK